MVEQIIRLDTIEEKNSKSEYKAIEATLKERYVSKILKHQ